VKPPQWKFFLESRILSPRFLGKTAINWRRIISRRRDTLSPYHVLVLQSHFAIAQHRIDTLAQRIPAVDRPNDTGGFAAG
jgi:hypothetical protein